MSAHHRVQRSQKMALEDKRKVGATEEAVRGTKDWSDKKWEKLRRRGEFGIWFGRHNSLLRDTISHYEIRIRITGCSYLVRDTNLYVSQNTGLTTRYGFVLQCILRWLIARCDSTQPQTTMYEYCQIRSVVQEITSWFTGDDFEVWETVL